MTDIFIRKSEYNQFDNLKVDINKIYRDFPITPKSNTLNTFPPFARTRLHKLYRSRFIPSAHRIFLHRLMRQIGIDLSWFQEFSAYWSQVLRGRPLWGVQDFYFLRNLYRVKFSANQVPDTEDVATHLEAWQRPEVIYQLFHQVYKEATRDEFAVLDLLFKYRKNARKILEFGCATAPIATSLFEFYLSARRMDIYISDIKTLAFHYAAYKFRQSLNVTPVLLLPENNFLPVSPEPLDAIFCMAVFEHLNQPLEAIKSFHELLVSGGLLILDYIKGDGAGLDTEQGVLQRDLVLDYALQNFEVLLGNLSHDKSMGTTVLRKK